MFYLLSVLVCFMFSIQYLRFRVLMCYVLYVYMGDVPDINLMMMMFE